MTTVEAPSKGVECFQALKAVHAAYDLAAGELSRQLGVPLCVENCGLCCLVNVPFSYGIEAAYAISNLIAENNLRAILDRAKDWLEENQAFTEYQKDIPTKHRHLSIFGTVEGGQRLEISPELNGEINALASTPCPFLNQEKRCTLHPYRPLTCRAFGVTRIAHRDCKRPLGRGEVAKTAYFGGMGATAIKEVLDKLLAEDPNPIGSLSGFFPSLLYAVAKPTEYRKLARSGKIAMAKLVLTEGAQGLLWQEQLEKERQRLISSSLLGV